MVTGGTEQLALLGRNISWFAEHADTADPTDHVHLEHIRDSDHYMAADALPLIVRLFDSLVVAPSWVIAKHWPRRARTSLAACPRGRVTGTSRSPRSVRRLRRSFSRASRRSFSNGSLVAAARRAGTWCERRGDLDALVERLKPGSSVSFYFDDRLSVGPFNDETLASLLAIIERDGNAVIGAVRDDEIEIKVDFPGSEEAAGEFVADHPDATLMHGSSPGRDNDGNRAVTLTLPDLDGVVRSHPH